MTKTPPLQKHPTKIHTHGHLQLLDVMGSDADIEAAARLSYTTADEDRTPGQTETLLRYLMRHEHWTPFEMAILKFRVKAPIFVARQWFRHRSSSFNEISARYSELPLEYYDPVPEGEEWPAQSTSNKQGSHGKVIHHRGVFDQDTMNAEEVGLDEYQSRLRSGTSREIARTCVPVSTYTEWVWCVNLRNLLHFLKLRLHPHAQQEIRDYAIPLAQVVEDHFPMTWAAFEDYHLESLTFSPKELAFLAEHLATRVVQRSLQPEFTDREIAELQAKLDRIPL